MAKKASKDAIATIDIFLDWLERRPVLVDGHPVLPLSFMDDIHRWGQGTTKKLVRKRKLVQVQHYHWVPRSVIPGFANETGHVRALTRTGYACLMWNCTSKLDRYAYDRLVGGYFYRQYDTLAVPAVSAVPAEPVTIEVPIWNPPIPTGTPFEIALRETFQEMIAEPRYKLLEIAGYFGVAHNMGNAAACAVAQGTVLYTAIWLATHLEEWEFFGMGIDDLCVGHSDEAATLFRRACHLKAVSTAGSDEKECHDRMQLLYAAALNAVP